jgi:hypothetical protein
LSFELIQQKCRINESLILVTSIISITAIQGQNMSIKKIITGLILSLLLSNGVASAADYNSAYSTFQSGNYEAAFQEMLPFAEQGNVDAQYYIARMYDEGRGALENDKAAVKWYTLAAEQGDRWAQYSLGRKYDFGEGAPENDKTAVKWYTLAAEQGYAGAQYSLGVMYDNGYGVPVNDKTAIKWYTLAAEQGNANAKIVHNSHIILSISIPLLSS